MTEYEAPQHRPSEVCHLWSIGNGYTIELKVSRDEPLKERSAAWLKERTLWPVLHLLLDALPSKDWCKT